ncbi:polysaccharide deacetylase family protein [Propylenella binzhouense]|uniref:Chitooligosaccharide deacetylase n=1 Tax=Propylenella binzhouense TaxID=2555902 RepID=A0A964T4S0_9HYPH|nr:polysaccharide deacetylase family protein [Propylenella binzhouense]MYZ48488.1 polysaccharide deacetylase [Propylenella binzhouense]
MTKEMKAPSAFARPAARRLGARDRLVGQGLRALALLHADRWLESRDGTSVAVTLHHVRPDDPRPFDPNAHLSITPEFLDSFIASMKGNGWKFVTVDGLFEAAPETADRRIAVTLDDGYRDNLEYALPVFRRHGCPFTIFVTPGYCDRTAELWWEALDRIIAGADVLEAVPGGPPKLPLRTVAEKEAAFRVWSGYLTTELDEFAQRAAIRRVADDHGLDLAALAAELVMDFDEVRAIAADPLCRIGAHTMTHPALKRLPEEVARREMRESADRIEAEIGYRPTAFAFPYGYSAAAGPREAQLAEQEGFVASFTTRPGCIERDGRRHGLPRISLNGKYQDPRLYPALFVPNVWRLARWLRSPG